MLTSGEVSTKRESSKRNLDVHGVSPTTLEMEAATPQHSFASIGRALGVSREAVRALKIRHELDDATLTNPDALFERLLVSGNSGKVRTLLSDPAKRREISAALI